MIYRRPTPQRSRTPVVVVLGLVLFGAAVVGLGWVGWRMVTAPEPKVGLTEPLEYLGRNRTVTVVANDPTGLRGFRVTMEQGGTTHVLHEVELPVGQTEARYEWSPAGEERFALQEGEGVLRAEARNRSWGGFFRGRQTQIEQPFTARLKPPRLEVLTSQHYVNHGGCDMIVYKVSPAGAESGVVVGDHFFRGFPLPGATEPGVHFAIFALPWSAPDNAPMKLRARDEAGNESLASFWVKVFPQRFRTRSIELTDGFLEKVVPEILSQSPRLKDKGSLLENYLAINRELRQTNNQHLDELAAQSRREFLWTQPFQQLGGSQVEARFADHRNYVYEGEQVDQQTHLGFDLATTRRAPVTASNSGVVMMADYFGIYGNTVVLDHGYGLLSLYGHMSSLDVQKDGRVERGQTIGRTGATGLAGGDHLHFSMVLQDVQVDPREWWDPHWIEDRIAAKLRQFGSGAGPGAPAKP